MSQPSGLRGDVKDQEACSKDTDVLHIRSHRCETFHPTILNDIFKLHARRSRVRVPIRSLNFLFSIYLILPAAPWPWG
jgi:hypothetical protein